MQILAIDQSFTSCGLIVMKDKKIVHAERLVTDDEKDKFERAWHVAQRSAELARQYNVECVALEGLAFSKFGDATRDLAGLQYTVVTTIRYLNLFKTCIIPPNTVKLVATGKGNAKKEPMYDALPQEVKDKFQDMNLKKTTGRYDLTDAYWIGIAATDILIEEKKRSESELSVAQQ